VATLCAQLEGIPLAIEMAAARARLLTPAQMLSQIEHRFDFLVSRQKNVAERHRTLWAAIEWSYHSLPAELRRFFARLSVFRGGWTLEAAEALTKDESGRRKDESKTHSFPPSSLILHPLEALAQLQTHSLILAEEADGAMRYRMLETLREFAGEHLIGEERRTTLQRHAHYFLRLAQEAEPHLMGAQQAAWMARLQAEHDNLRAVLTWCLSETEEEEGEEEASAALAPPLLALQLIGSLWIFWARHGNYQEGRFWVERVLGRPETQARTALRAKALNGAGGLAYNQGDLQAALTLLREAGAIRREVGDRAGMAGSLNNIGQILQMLGDLPAARKQYEEALAYFRGSDDRIREATILNNLGTVLLDMADFDAAARCFHEALALNRALDNPVEESAALVNLSNIAYLRADYAAARALLEQALPICRAAGFRYMEANQVSSLGAVLCEQGDYARARMLMVEAVRIRQEIGAWRDLPQLLDNFARLALKTQQFRRAAMLYGAISALRRAGGLHVPELTREQHEANIALTRAGAGEQAFAECWQQGEVLSLEQAVALALQPS
jgi:tetratricopeptide (TPR) repeat protein